MTSFPDVIALGETMLSLVSADAPLSTTSELRVTFGGAEANTCVGLARLGLHATWVSRLGLDPPGERVMTSLEAAGVDVQWVRRDPDRPTGLMLRDTRGRVCYYRNGSAASALSPDDLRGVPIAEARVVLVTGVTALLGPGPQRAAVALLDAARGLRVVDPNLRPGLWGSDRAKRLIGPLIERSDLLLGGEAELGAFVGDLHGERLARACRSLGPAEVVVKRGSAGAGALDEHGAWHDYTGEPVRDVDPVGAGDAFNAGYVAARLSGAAPLDALAAGARCGAAVASAVGDTEGFPLPTDGGRPETGPDRIANDR
jgi:2-dehydro-3-deoxygluconokinase